MFDPRLIEKGDGEAAMFEAYCGGNRVAIEETTTLVVGSCGLLAHPGGPMKTNKAAALAKFLERKSQEPSGLSSINPKLVELAVKNAKETLLYARNASNSERRIQHVKSFGDYKDMIEEDQEMEVKPIKLKKKKKKKTEGAFYF
ncbi:unnamed protein product [Lactuca virosa]|uniref:Uncharacterized protein n=1 Tax=Lactuca virosa TaxID=75947 RepID=A0AAU9M9I9_9ASTR|nr:unnamed protein product [Lactuca virosa]